MSLFFVLSAFVFTVGSANRKLNFAGFYRNRELERQPWDEKTPLERHAAMTWPFSHIHVLHGT